MPIMTTTTSLAIVSLITGWRNRVQQDRLAIANREHGFRVQQLQQEFQRSLQQKNFVEAERLQRVMANLQYQNALRLQELNQKRDWDRIELADVWPLYSPPYHYLRLLESYTQNGKLPLQIILPASMPDGFKSVYRDMDRFFQNEYGDKTFYYDGGWKENMKVQRAQQCSLQKNLSGCPTLIMIPEEINGEGKIRLSVTYWGIGAMDGASSTEELFSIHKDDFKVEIIKRMADDFTQLYQNMETPPLIDKLIRLRKEENERYRILEEQQKTDSNIKQIIAIEFNQKYLMFARDPDIARQISKNEVKMFSDMMCIVGAMLADIHRLLDYQEKPHALSLIDKFASDSPDKLLKIMADCYLNTIDRLSSDAFNLPLHYALVASAFNEVSGGQEYAKQFATEGWKSLQNLYSEEGGSIMEVETHREAYLMIREISDEESIGSLNQYLKNNIEKENMIAKLREIIENGGERDFSRIICMESPCSVRERLAVLRDVRNQILRDSTICQQGQNGEIIADRRRNILNKIDDEIKLIIKETAKFSKIESFSDISDFDYDAAKHSFLQLLMQDKLYLESVKPTVKTTLSDLADYGVLVKEVVNDCNNSKYTAVLLGEYQTGKTTTLDAIFCEGSGIGAIGKGVKTSAVPLYAAYSEEEKIDIVWRTKEELQDVIGAIRDQVDTVDNAFDETNKAVLLESIEKIRTTGTLYTKASKEIQNLTIASIILEYWNSREYLELLQKGNFSIQEIKMMSRFPEDMEETWTQSGARGFDIKEIAFVFIRQINYYCPSQTLKKLNCTIVDCPGLFASGYDTSVTNRVVASANALILLLPRDRSANNETFRELLATIKEEYPQAHHKLIFGNNLSFCEKNSQTIRDSNREFVKQYFSSSIDIVCYDALLSHYGQLKSAYDSGTLSHEIEKKFIEDYKNFCQELGVEEDELTEDFEEVWNDHIVRYFPRHRGSSLTAADVFDKSRKEELLKVTSDFVHRNKAYSIIVTEGVEKLTKRLDALRCRVNTMYVEPYLVGKDQLQKDWDAREKIAQNIDDTIVKYLTEICLRAEKQNGNQALSIRLSDNEYARLFSEQSKKKLANEISEGIFQNLGKIAGAATNNQRLRDVVTSVVEARFQKYIRGIMTAWNYQLVDENGPLNVDISTYLTLFENQFDIYWSEAFSSDEIMRGMRKRYINVPKGIFETVELEDGEIKLRYGAKEVEELCERIRQMYVASKDYLPVAATGALAVTAGILTIVVPGVVSAVTSIISIIVSGFCCDPTGTVQFALAAIAGAVGLFAGVATISSLAKRGYDAFVNKVKNYFIRQILPRIENALNSDAFNQAMRKMVSERVNTLMLAYMSMMRVDMKLLIKDKNNALLSFDDADDLENRCFEAIEIIDSCNKQITEYNKFIDTLKRKSS